jgi:hypothetical protein
MTETGGTNIEIAHHLNETKKGEHQPSHRAETLEVFEAIVLAVVAVATAWSGYQAARWDGRQSLLGTTGGAESTIPNNHDPRRFDHVGISRSTCSAVADRDTTTSLRQCNGVGCQLLLLKDHGGSANSLPI